MLFVVGVAAVVVAGLLMRWSQPPHPAGVVSVEQGARSSQSRLERRTAIRAVRSAPATQLASSPVPTEPTVTLPAVVPVVPAVEAAPVVPVVLEVEHEVPAVTEMAASTEVAEVLEVLAAQEEIVVAPVEPHPLPGAPVEASHTVWSAPSEPDPADALETDAATPAEALADVADVVDAEPAPLTPAAARSDQAAADQRDDEVWERIFGMLRPSEQALADARAARSGEPLTGQPLEPGAADAPAATAGRSSRTPSSDARTSTVLRARHEQAERRLGVVPDPRSEVVELGQLGHLGHAGQVGQIDQPADEPVDALQPAAAPAGAATATKVRRCGVCRAPGHDRRRCPEREAVS